MQAQVVVVQEDRLGLELSPPLSGSSLGLISELVGKSCTVIYAMTDPAISNIGPPCIGSRSCRASISISTGAKGRENSSLEKVPNFSLTSHNQHIFLFALQSRRERRESIKSLRFAALESSLF
jgi:hypothetical protein